MPGKLIAVLATTGQKVRAGQSLAVLEAMKMEHILAAPRDGAVAEIAAAPGDQVTEGMMLIRLEP
jgi:3-methylcrotonyl-CoA carboxylase alpha subunit